MTIKFADMAQERECWVSCDVREVSSSWHSSSVLRSSTQNSSRRTINRRMHQAQRICFSSNQNTAEPGNLEPMTWSDGWHVLWDRLSWLYTHQLHQHGWEYSPAQEPQETRHDGKILWETREGKPPAWMDGTASLRDPLGSLAKTRSQVDSRTQWFLWSSIWSRFRWVHGKP